jgi:membrane protein
MTNAMTEPTEPTQPVQPTEPTEPTQPTQPPKSPRQLSGRSWARVLARTVREFKRDNLTVWAAALTYYAVLSIFPGLLVLVSVLGMIGESAIQPLLDNLGTIAPGPAQEILTQAAEGLQESQGTAGVLFVVGLAAALWSASGYVWVFMRASNAVYDVPEGRPLWKTLPLRLLITVVVGVIIAAAALAVVVTGPLAEWLGDLVGAGATAVTIWDIAKWPVLVILISIVISILYWASPNARLAGFRWITPGGLLAVLLWIIASAGFALYVANFGSYNRTYGTLGGVIIFFIWLWISNLAVLLGAELDAELHRGRAIAAGHPEDEEPFLPLRDTRKLDREAGSGPS